MARVQPRLASHGTEKIKLQETSTPHRFLEPDGRMRRCWRLSSRSMRKSCGSATYNIVKTRASLHWPWRNHVTTWKMHNPAKHTRKFRQQRNPAVDFNVCEISWEYWTIRFRALGKLFRNEAFNSNNPESVKARLHRNRRDPNYIFVIHS